jgi:transcriptional regulator with XRE-family HTH domain
MHALSSTSQRRTHASRFALELRRAIKARGASKLRISEATRIPRSNLGYYLAGRNLPTISTARTLSEVLDAPRLLEIVIAGRTVRCGRPGCPRTFLYEGGKPKVYCSEDCRELGYKMRAGEDPLHEGAKRLYDGVKTEVDRVHGTTGAVSRRVLASVLDEYARSGSKRHAKLTRLQRRIDGYAESVGEGLRSVSHLGYTPCEHHHAGVRCAALSPLPLAGTYVEERPSGQIREAEGPWGPNNRPAQIVAIRAANAVRWSRPGEREAARAIMEARYAAETPEDKAERARRISAGRRRAS